MGLFDRLIKKAVSTATNTITDTIIENTVKPNVEKVVKDSLGIEEVKYDIPSVYASFPVYSGSMVSKPVETNTSKYTRLTINYAGSIDNEYVNTLLSNGYIKGSNVRYDKENTYVILEADGSNTRVVYHIKK